MEPLGLPPLVLPEGLRPHRPAVEAYAMAKLQRFAYGFARRINPALTQQQIDLVAGEVLQSMSAAPEPPQALPQQSLRLVLRHDCLSSGCGDANCALCQYNPSRICKRNLKPKYLIDDHLRAKCGAGLRIEVVDENGVCVTEATPDMQLEVHVMNGEKYKELCPDNTLLSNPQLRSCILAPTPKKPLLKRESGLGMDDTRIFLPLEQGQAPLSDLQCTTSSEALLAGKAPTFRLLVWAVDGAGAPLGHVTYVVSESFVVATKRVKHAIKSDIPSITDHVSKLVHIGKATVDKLQDLRQAASEENVDLDVPEHLWRVTKVGQFRELVEMTEQSSDLKHKLRHLLKLSPEKWEEVSQHTLSAVVPDFRPRVWWHPGILGGLLFACKNGALLIDHALGYVHRDPTAGVETPQPLLQADPQLFALMPKLKQQAMQDWFAPGHISWSVYWRDPADPLAQQMVPGPNGPNLGPTLPRGIYSQADLTRSQEAIVAAAAAAAAAAGQQGGGLLPNGAAAGLPPHLYGQAAAAAAQMQQQQQFGQRSGGGSALGAASAAAAAAAFSSAPPVPPVSVPLPSQQRHSVPGYSTARSPFATQNLQQTLSAAFPAFAGASPAVTPHGTQPGGGPSSNGGAPPGQLPPPPQQQQQQQHPQHPQQQHPQHPQHPQQQQLPQQGVSQQQAIAMQQAAQAAAMLAAQQARGGGGGSAPGSAAQSGGGGMPPPGSAAAAAAAAGAAVSLAEVSKLGGVLPSAGMSLEMLNTDDLPPIDRGASLWPLDSFQQNIQGMQMLGELPSAALDVPLVATGGHGAGAAALHGAGPGQPERALSLKFSMSLDLADEPAAQQGGGGGAGGQ